MDQERVCCLCGDVGFPQKLFRCSRCRFRFQHSYCSNYYNGGNESSKTTLCDWCQIQDHPSSLSSSSASFGRPVITGTDTNKRWEEGHVIRSEYTSRERIKLHRSNNHEDQNQKRPISNKNNSSSPRPNGHRRYKLLKDVMC